MVMTAFGNKLHRRVGISTRLTACGRWAVSDYHGPRRREWLCWHCYPTATFWERANER